MKVRRFAFGCALVGAVALLVLAGALSWRFGSLPLAVAWLHGERFVLSPAEVDFGECESRTDHDVKFRLTNLTARPIRIVGGEQSCSCAALEKLPMEIGARENGEISVRFFVVGDGQYSQELILYIDDGGELKSVVARIRARIRQAERG